MKVSSKNSGDIMKSGGTSSSDILFFSVGLGVVLAS